MFLVCDAFFLFSIYFVWNMNQLTNVKQTFNKILNPKTHHNAQAFKLPTQGSTSTPKMKPIWWTLPLFRTSHKPTSSHTLKSLKLLEFSLWGLAQACLCLYKEQRRTGEFLLRSLAWHFCGKIQAVPVHVLCLSLFSQWNLFLMTNSSMSRWEARETSLAIWRLLFSVMQTLLCAIRQFSYQKKKNFWLHTFSLTNVFSHEDAKVNYQFILILGIGSDAWTGLS